MRTRNANTHGMTLVELLVVMTVIAVMAAMLGLVVPSVTKHSAEAATRTAINKLIATIQLYYEDCGQYPDAINHDPQRGVLDVPANEPAGTYPMTNELTKSRPLYGTYFIEGWGSMPCSELVGTLGGTTKGWGRPQLSDVFNRNRELTSKTKQLCDGWGRRLCYMPYFAYRTGTSASTKNSSGTAMILKNKAKGPFQNPRSYQIYSAGQNMKTGFDYNNKGGTDVDDITNWGATTD